MRKKQNYLLVTHATEIFGGPHALRDYLMSRAATLIFIYYPLDKTVRLRPTMEVYKNGKLEQKQHLPLVLEKIPFSYFRDFVATLYLAFKFKRNIRFDYYIGANNLNCLAGLILRPFLNFRRVIFYSVDYSPVRFKNKVMNWIYQTIDKIVVRQADATWNNTHRVMAIRKKQGIRAASNLFVSNGVDLKKIPKIKRSRQIKKIIYVGNLTKTKGVQDIIAALPAVVKRFPQVELLIVGGGPYRSDLEKLTAKLRLSRKVKFLGQKTNAQTLKIISKSDIGVALYRRDDSYTHFCDPIKVKEYLACGCSVIISDVPEIAKIIEREKVGVVINKLNEIAPAVLYLLGQDLNRLRRSAKNLAQKYDWGIIFDHAFAKA